jgi:enoyl-CoA hydratase
VADGLQTLLYEYDDHVVTLTYNCPDQHNAVDRTMNRELHQASQRCRDDPDAFVLVITGAGEAAFCAGWDLAVAADLNEPGDWDAFRVGLHNNPGECGYTRRTDVYKPVIAAVNGYAFATGTRDRAARRHPHRGRERRVRGARTTLEHRRR